MKCRIKKGDKVIVLAGADKTSEPREVLSVDREAGTVIVQGTNLRWKHQRRSPQAPDGGRTQSEHPMNISNVQLFSSKAGKGVRARVELVDGKRVRVGTCGTQFD